MEFGTNANWQKRLRSKKAIVFVPGLSFFFFLSPLRRCILVCSLLHVVLKICKYFSSVSSLGIQERIIALLIFFKLYSTFLFIVAILSLFSSYHFAVFVYFSILVHVKYLCLITNPSRVTSFSSCKQFFSLIVLVITKNQLLRDSSRSEVVNLF